MALQFAGGSNYLSQAVPFTGLADFTMMFNVKLTASQTANRKLVGYGYDDGVSVGNGILFGFQGAGTTIKIVDGGIAWRGSGFTAEIDKTYHIAVTANGGTGYNYYVDGLLFERTLQGAIAPTAFTVGGTTGGIPAPDAIIDSLGIWNYGLSQEQVFDVYMRRRPMQATLESAVRYFPLSLDYKDISKNATPLILTGSIPFVPDLGIVQKTNLSAAEFAPVITQQFDDAATVYFDIQPSGTDVPVYTDSATVYFNLQASGISDGLANDKCTNAIDILINVPSIVKETIAGTTVDATSEAAFEDHPSYGGSPAVWYHIAPAEDYRFAWRITKTGGTSGWLPGADLIRCTTYPPVDADDFDWLQFFGDGTTTPPYQHEVNLLAGEHYLIAVSEYNYTLGEEGDFDLDVQAVPGYLFESWEDGSIDPIVWERRIISASPDDPNTGIWTIETDEVTHGTYSLKSTPTALRQQLHHHDTAQGGDTDRDYWMAYKFFITDWNDILTSDSESVDMPCITNGNNTSFPHGGTGLIASAWQTYLYADTSTTGWYEDNDGGANYLTTGWHELKVKYRKRSSDNHLIIKEILDGVVIVNDVDFGVFAGSITGISWMSTDGAYTSGPLQIDSLVWSPDVEPTLPTIDYEDDDVVYFDLQPSGVDAFSVTIDAATVYFDLTPSSVQVFAGIDSATVDLNLTASGSDIYSPPCLIIGEGEAQLRWTAADDVLRWLAADADLRFTSEFRFGTAHC